MSRSQMLVLATFVSIAAVINAAWGQPPKRSSGATAFALSPKTRELIREVQTPLVSSIAQRFGNPSEPIVPEGFPVDAAVVQGERVYATHCASCHGAGGDGTGPKSKMLDPKPRDFRLGIFKWKSTRIQEKVLRQDLRETLRLGIPGTAMPSFAELPEADRNAAVEYVRWLGMAGETEFRLALEFEADFSSKAVSAKIAQGMQMADIKKVAVNDVKERLPSTIDETLSFLQERWKNAELETSIIRPTGATPSDDASIKRGRAIYLSQRTKCNTCHGDDGKGDGPATRDHWNVPGSNEKYQKPGLHDTWGNLNQPWDLTTGKFRGGSSPDDLYLRIYSGISGTTMPGYGGGALTNEAIWDLVNYIRSIPTEKLEKQPAGTRLPAPAGKSD